MRQPFVAATGRDDAEAGGAGPIHQIANQRRLVAVGQAVDYAGFRRPAREQWPAHRIRFHGDHDDMLAMPECGECVFDCGDRVAGCLDDDVDQRMCHERLPVVAHMCEAGRECRVQ